jgi:hypothetical protein
MNRLLPAALLFCAAAFLSNPAWSFQGFDLFEQLQHSIGCARKPATDIMVCSNKFVPTEAQEEQDTPPEPVTEPTSKWDLYNRERIYFDESQIQKAGCADPSKNLVYLNLDVDLDGDQDVIFGFTCFKPVIDTEYLRQHVTYDEFYGWIADQYLAVFINNDGVFENDQSIFGGEYPVFDTTLKAKHAFDVGDVNGDGYHDVVFQHHWDNSVHDIVNERAFKDTDNWSERYVSNGGSVMLSDGNGGYVTHVLPFQNREGIPAFYTDNMGDTYLWMFSTKTFMPSDWVDDYEARTLDLEVRPYVGKVSGADLIDVTDRYWERQDNLPSHLADHCWVQRGMAVNGEYPRRADRPGQPGCMNPANQIVQDYSQVNFQGKVYINVLGQNTKGEIWDIEPTDTRLSECEYLYNIAHNSGNQEDFDQFEDCKVEVMSGPWELESLQVLSMDTERGVYVSSTIMAQGEYRFYEIPVELQSEYRNRRYHGQYFLDLGDQYLLTHWDWGLTIADNGSDLVVMLNMPGALLDPGVEIDDLDEFFDYAINDRPPAPASNTNFIIHPHAYLEMQLNIWSIMDSGFCVDFIDTVEPEDCDNPDWWTQNRVDRFETRETEHGRSLAYRVSKTDGVIADLPELTNFNMAFNPFKSQLIDFDGDGDLDYYLSDYNMECGAMCYYENVGDFELVMDLNGIWGQADAEFWAWQSVACAGPQRPEDGFSKNAICDLGYDFNDTMLFLQPDSGNVTISDINGDGIPDFYAVKNEGYIEIIYGE